MLTISKIIDENKNRILFWNNLNVEGLRDHPFSTDMLQSQLTELASYVEAVLSKKLQDPLAAVELTEQLSGAIDALLLTIEEIANYNDTVATNNDAIQAFKVSLQDADNAAEIRKELHLVRDRKKRHSGAVNELCSAYTVLVAQKKTLEGEKAALRQSLDSTSQEIIVKHQNAINDCLAKSGASFQLERIDQDHRGGRPNSTFVLKLNGEEVAAGSMSENAPSIKTCLSAGDKTTLAFAFFISCAL